MFRHGITLLLIVSATVLTAHAQKKEEKKEEVNKLEGAWTATGWARGEGFIGPDMVNTELVVGKDTYEFPKGINRISGKGAYKLTAGKNHVDFTPADGPAKGKTLLGIYKVEGDKLTLCFRSAGAERPTEFKSGDRMTVVASYERKKKKDD